MNIIEQLGGYEKCKDILSRPNIDFIMNAQGLREHMLEYRRQHNIFEVGDYVCFKTLGDGYVHKYTKYHEFKYDLKHANDAEIKAGHRLP